MTESHALEVLAVIPARGGSAGISRKNLREVGGVPLLVRTIRAAKASRHVTRTVVSTDDPEIAAVASEEGAEVVQRPAELATGTASSEAVILHTLAELQMRQYTPDLVAFLQCTSPFTAPDDIDGVVDLLLRTGADCAFTATQSHFFLWKVAPDGTATADNHDMTRRPMRQQLDPQYSENGAVYVMKAAQFIEAQHRFFGRAVLYPMPEERSLQIDTPYELRLANFLALDGAGARSGTLLPNHLQALILDFDGVLTDNRVFVLEDGREGVFCSREDGFGLERLRDLGFRILVVSKEKNPVVAQRCAKLQIECLQAVDEKRTALEAWFTAEKIAPEQAVFVGNDLNDLSAFSVVGVKVAVGDAHPAVRSAADIVLRKHGGRGAVREICELIEQNLAGANSHG